MSYIIDATANGLQQTIDAYPETHLKLQSNGVTQLTVTPDGLIGDFGNGGGGGASGPAFISNQTAAQTIANGVNTKVTLVSSYDSDTAFTNSRFTPKVAGIYHFDFRASIILATTGTSPTAYLYKNGNQTAKGSITYAQGNGQTIGSTGSFLVKANGTTDYFELYVSHTANSPQNTGTPQSSSGNSECVFSGHFVRSI